MYTIVVTAAASRLSGALTMYNQFLNHLKNHAGENYYHIFVHPSMPKPKIDGVRYIEIDITSTLNRLKFDYWGCYSYLKKHEINADLLFSFENTGVRVKNLPQIILYQQGLPFYPKKWNPFKASERTLFVYTYIYPMFVKVSLFKNSKVIVHTPYLRERFSDKYHYNKSRIYAMLPDVEKVDVDACESYDFGNASCNFIYPSANIKYKEHNTLIKALAIMRDKNPDQLSNIRIHLTLKKEENQKLVRIIEEEKLSNNFVFVGFVPREQLLAMYKSCKGLLFPSTIESVTLPLWEAVAFNKPVVCQDLDFTRYQLEGYEGVSFVKEGDYEAWCDAIIATSLQNKKPAPYTPVKGNSWEDLFKWIENTIVEYKNMNKI